MRPIDLLFLCAGNSERSVIAEALLGHRGVGRFRAFSAGSRPTGRVNPLTLELLRRRGLPDRAFRSKSWDEFAGPAAPVMDAIVTVCDSAAGEVCPIWPGRPVTAHWGFPDPAAATGNGREKRMAFNQVFDSIALHVEALVALPGAALAPDRLPAELRAIGDKFRQ